MLRLVSATQPCSAKDLLLQTQIIMQITIEETQTDLDSTVGLQAFRGSASQCEVAPHHDTPHRTTATETGQPNLDSTTGLSPRFQQTQWTLVRRAGFDSAQSREALEELCRAYWFPIYAFIRRN